jgi:hypothetical protein
LFSDTRQFRQKALARAKRNTNGYSLCLIDSNNIMADPNPIAQQGITPAAVGVPLGGVDYLLDVVGLHNPAERLRIIKAGLTNYKDFRYLIDKDICDTAEEFAK